MENKSDRRTKIIKTFAPHLSSRYANIHLAGAETFKNLQNRGNNIPIDELDEPTIVKRCVDLLNRVTNPTLQFESCWMLTHIAAGTSEESRTVVDAGAVPHLVNLLSSTHEFLVHQAICVLGNLVGDNLEARDSVLNAGAIPKMLDLIKLNSRMSFVGRIIWAMANIFRMRKPPAPITVMRECLPTLARALYSQDADVIRHACWTLSYLSDNQHDLIQDFIDIGIVRRLVQLLERNEENIIIPTLRLIGNIAAGNDAQTDIILNSGCLRHIVQLLRHQSTTVTKYANFVISNITAGTVDQIRVAIAAGVLAPIVENLSKGNSKSQKQAAWAVANLLACGSESQVITLCRLNVLKPFCGLLSVSNENIVHVVLDGLKSFLQIAERFNALNRMTAMIEECGGLEKLQELQNNEKEDIYVKTSNLINEYFAQDIFKIF